MARVCVTCGKGKLKGNLVSHSNIKTNRHYSPNVQKVRLDIDGKQTKEYVCTRCLRTMRQGADATSEKERV